MSDIDVTEMGDAGKARPVPRGRYSDTETYDYLDFVYSGDASYIAKKLTTGNPPAENNEYWQLFARGGTLTENSDVSDTTVTFEQAENRANIFSKDSLKTIMGKISKMYSDLKTVAFSGKYTDLEGRVTVTNNDLATIPGTAWDAVRGAQIRKDLDKLNSDLLTFKSANLLKGVCNATDENLANFGKCYKCGNFVIVKAYFASMHFVTNATMFVVPEGFRPKSMVEGIIHCQRLSGGQEIATNLCIVSASGNISQQFNSEGTASIWHGDFFALYKL